MVLNIGDLEPFTGFLRLCAGSTAQELNLARLGADAGISQPRAHHYREVAGLEVDLMVQDGLSRLLAEAKSGRTMNESFLAPLLEAKERLEPTQAGTTLSCALVYGGDQPQQRKSVRVVPWSRIEELAPD